MPEHLTGKSRLTLHLLLGAILVVCAVVIAHSASVWRAVASAAPGTLAAYAAIAIAVHVGLALGGAGVLLGVLRSHGRKGSDAPGATLHAPRFYDWLAAAYCLGREGRMREGTLDVAGVAAGEHVLDVCCGTGTLALAAKQRVGESGSVHAVDASAEMIARARAKSGRRGLPVAFELAPAQSLPFPEARFDVVLCTLALHHLEDDGDRARAIAEMRRVLKPGGRLLVVEFGKRRGAWALLHPVALLHAHKTPEILDRGVMRRAGFGRVVTGPLGYGVLAYALAHLD
jgi:ubiquinone/menaquinone biosynthesis C-methylase UbiE